MPDHLHIDSLNWANTHIERFGDTDICPVPFEYIAIRHSWPVVRDELLKIDLSTYECRPHRRFLVPKPSGGFRVTAQLDPLDALIYAALVYEAAHLLENQRIPKAQRIACSYRLSIDPQGRLYSSQDGWGDFTQHSQELSYSGTYNYVVVADTTDFYNQISHHRIRNILETSGVLPERAKNLESFLMNLTRGHSQGIPVGPSASILLAEACLADVDMFLLREGYKHTRYVDDYRIFCKDRTEAHQALHDLSEYLYTAHRLSLRAENREPLAIADFIKYFLLDPEQLEEETRSEKLKLLANFLRDFTGYNIAVEDIPEADKHQAVLDNLAELFDICLSQQSLHLGWARYLLRQATSLKTNVLLHKCLHNLEKLAPVMRDVGRYLPICVNSKNKRQIGNALINFIKDNDLGVLPFLRLWILDILVSKLSSMFEQEIINMAKASTHGGLQLRPLALLALDRGHIDWVRRHKEIWQNCAPWDRRAIIWSGKALPQDERNYWIKRVENAGDILDRVVAKAVMSNL